MGTDAEARIGKAPFAPRKRTAARAACQLTVRRFPAGFDSESCCKGRSQGNLNLN
jgi:hypothetical protein